MNGCVVDIPPAQLNAVRKHPMVRALHPDRPVVRGRFIKVATDSRNHAVDTLQSQGIRGAGVAVAIIDSGIDSNMAGTGRPHRAFFVNGDVTNRTGGGIGGSRILENVPVNQRLTIDESTVGGAPAQIAAVAHYQRHAWSNNTDDVTQPRDVIEYTSSQE